MANNFIQELKSQYKFGGMHMKLIFLNAAIFLLIGLCEVFARLISSNAQMGLHSLFIQIFGLETNLFSFFLHPWGILTSIFAHFQVWHFLMNMLFLYFAGRAFEQFFDKKRLLYTYLLGGIFGGIFEIFAHSVFPALQMQQTVVVGASGSVMAIFSAIAFYRPAMEVRLFGLFPIRIIFLALFFVVIDLFQLGKPDGVAHFAHLGGFVLGFLSVNNLSSKNNVINLSMRLVASINSTFSFQRKRKLKVVQKNARFKSDEEYNLELKLKQEEIDRILDKIAKSGYDSLSKHEKDLLFKQSKK